MYNRVYLHVQNASGTSELSDYKDLPAQKKKKKSKLLQYRAAAEIID